MSLPRRSRRGQDGSPRGELISFLPAAETVRRTALIGSRNYLHHSQMGRATPAKNLIDRSPIKTLTQAETVARGQSGARHHGNCPITLSFLPEPLLMRGAGCLLKHHLEHPFRAHARARDRLIGSYSMAAETAQTRALRSVEMGRVE